MKNYRSRKGQERLADQLMSLSTKLISWTYGTFAILAGFFVAGFIGLMPEGQSVLDVIAMLKWQTILGFIIFYLVPLIIAAYLRRSALNIYDHVSVQDRLMRL